MSTPARKTAGPLVVKIGGRAAEDDGLIAAMADELAAAASRGPALLVHGGGSTVSALQERWGVEPRFVDGLRQTAPAEMPLVDMALSGAVNKKLVRLLRTRGLAAWGLCGADGGLMRAESIGGDAGANRTGAVRAVDAAPLELLWGAGYFPVCAPPATDEAGRGMNVNADEAALELAAALGAGDLVFLSDVPGVLEDGAPIDRLTPAAIEEKIASGVIAGGMIPKTRSAAGALRRGVGAVTIGEYAGAGHLKELLSGNRGTRIETGG